MNETIIFRFPFEDIKSGSTVAIYGAGKVGHDYIQQIKKENYCNVLYVADENYEQTVSFNGFEVCSPDRLASSDEYDYVVISSLYCAYAMHNKLKSLGVPPAKVICAFQFGIKNYATYGEDLIVYTILKMLGKKFSYIDLGANDPYKNSTTAYLYVHGGRGICVEPNPDQISKLKENRPEDIVLNVGVAPKSGALSYYSFESHWYNTFSSSVADQKVREGHALKNTLEIPVVTLNEIIETYADGIFPEFLDIDIEGLDYDVLSSCDFSNSSPAVICVETHEGHLKKMNEMLDLKGFAPFHRSWSNMIYLRKDLKEKYPDIITLSD